jgi:hypothetical protein
MEPTLTAPKAGDNAFLDEHSSQHCRLLKVNLGLLHRASPQQSRGFFGGSKGTFTSFFSRTGHSAGASPGGDASIHGGAAGHFRQVQTFSCCDVLVLEDIERIQGYGLWS